MSRPWWHPKPWWLSKTLWFNALMAIVTFAVEVLPLLDQLVALGLAPEIAAKARVGLTVVTLVGNAILRSVTSKALSLK
ncbi:hypothetical protein [Ruegeria sp. HKCCD8929]|uniref:hypothetical protein n=1 Tax=Ruegeria sp. HKCCD8929 TaxID=2683006 RepID=UPI0014880278|nr:hypothetical protein [Ruegeria sp. HKCCD8929]